MGTSRNYKYFPEGSDVTFLDYSANSLQMAMTKLNPFIRPTYTIGEVENIPFSDNTFDTVIDTFGLVYVARPERALQEIKRYTSSQIEYVSQEVRSC